MSSWHSALLVKYMDKLSFVGFEVSTAEIMKNVVFWNVAQCGSCENRRFGGTCRLHLQDIKILVLGKASRLLANC
jgi:hypothetical protein